MGRDCKRRNVSSGTEDWGLAERWNRCLARLEMMLLKGEMLFG